MGNSGAWLTFALFAAPAVTAALNGWRPWEIVALVGILAPSGAVAAWAWAWHAVQTQRAESAERAKLSSDEQSAKLLGESLGKFGSYLSDSQAQEIWSVFASAPTEAKRTMALAVAGVVVETTSYLLGTAVGKVRAIAAGYRAPDAAPAQLTDEQVARSFGEALGRCSEALDEQSARELGELFAALPRDAQRAATSALTGYTETGYLQDDTIGPRLLALVRAFRDDAPDGAPADLAPRSA